MGSLNIHTEGEAVIFIYDMIVIGYVLSYRRTWDGESPQMDARLKIDFREDVVILREKLFKQKYPNAPKEPGTDLRKYQ